MGPCSMAASCGCRWRATAVLPTRTTAAGDRHPVGTAAAATGDGAAVLGAAGAADPGAGAVPGPEAALATAAPSLGPALVLARGRPPSPDLPEDPSPSPRRSPDPARGPGPGRDPEVLRLCRRESPSLGRGPRAHPSLQKKRERFHLKKMVMSAGI